MRESAPAASGQHHYNFLFFNPGVLPQRVVARHKQKPIVNPNLDRLQSYPFQKLTALLAGATPDPRLAPITLHIGEPKHPTPEFIKRTLADHLAELASYPAMPGAPPAAGLAENQTVMPMCLKFRFVPIV